MAGINLGAFAQGLGQGFQTLDNIYATQEERKFRREDRERAKEEGARRLSLLDEQVTSARQANELNARIGGIQQQMIGTPERELAGPVPDGGTDRAKAGLMVPAQAGLQGPDLWQAAGRLAALRGDVGGMSVADAQQRAEKVRSAKIAAGNEFDQIVKAGKENDLTEQFSNAPGIPAYMSQIDPRTGFSRMMLKDGKQVDLSRDERRALYIGIKLREVDPDEAEKIVSGMSDKMRNLVVQMNALTAQVTQANNQARTGESTDQFHRGQNAASMMQAQAAMAQAGVAKERLGLEREQVNVGRMGAIQYFEVPDGNGGMKVEARIPTMTRGKGLSWEPVELPGKPYNKPPADKVQVGPGGEIVRGQDVFVLNPKTGKYEKANLGPSLLDQKLAELEGGGPGGTPRGGLAVPGDEYGLSAMPYAQLQQMAKKPQGVSTDEARAAMRELERRRTQDYIGPSR